MAAWVAFGTGTLFAQEQPLIQIKVIDAHPHSVVKVRVENSMKEPVSIWQPNNSWGWGNWTFEFFDGNKLTIFVRKPDEGFTVNVPFPIKISGSGSIDCTFDLNDGTWVSHTIPISPTYPSKAEERDWVKGCLTILAIPPSREGKDFGIWTGVTTSPLKKSD